jgi:type II secretory pathway component PulK
MKAASYSQQGSALVLVFWCLILLSIAIVGLVEMVELSVEHTTDHDLQVQARALAESGVALGTYPTILKDDPLLAQQVAPGRSFRVKIGSEGARLNLNYILQTGHRDVLMNLFTRWGLTLDESNHVIDCLTDWISPSGLRSLNGAVAADYAAAGLPQRPSGKPFVSLDEVGLVLGFDLVEKAKPDWRDTFTLWSSGPLNVNEAPAALIAAVFDLEESRVDPMVNARNGRDGIAGTSDDVPLQNMTQLQTYLGLSQLQVQTLGNMISFSDPFRRVESVGQAGQCQVKVSVVTQLQASPPKYLLWSEQ